MQRVKMLTWGPIEMLRIIDSDLVDDTRSNQSRELDQRVPVATVASKTRRLDCKDCADATFADRRQ
jgi:hypothetical protein